MVFENLLNKLKMLKKDKYLLKKGEILGKIRNFEITNYIDLKVEYNNFKDDEDIVLEMINNYNARHQHFPLWEVSEKTRNQTNVAFEAVKNYPSNLAFLSNDLKANHFVVKEAVMRDGLTLMYASKELRANVDIIKAALINNIEAVEFVQFDESNYMDVLNFIKKMPIQENVR